MHPARRDFDEAHQAGTIPDLDIYRSANQLVKQHSAEATIFAAMNADAMLDRGDLDGERVWLRIIRAIEELLQRQPTAGEVQH